MNYLHHPNLLVQFWASLNTEFDKILDNFVRGDGWLFQDLGVAAKKANIGAVYRCVCTVVNSNQGREERLDHFLRVNFVILDAAKTQWLVPWRNYVVDPKNGVIPPFLKRQVGGFFLLYMLYVNQPLPNRFYRKQKILMDPRDIIALHVFTTTLQRLPKKTDPQLRELARQVVVLYNDLVVSEAFAFGAVNDTFATPNLSVRQLLANKLCMFTKTIYTVKDLRDQLYYITHQESKKMFQSLIAYGRCLPEEKQRSSSTQNETEKPAEFQGKSEEAFSTKDRSEDFHPTDKQWTVEEIKSLENENDVGKLAHNVTCILSSLTLEPTFTRERLTGISDSLLDLELDNFVSTHQSYLKVLENHSRKTRVRKHENASLDYTGRGRNPVTALDALKRYLSGDFGWVDDIFNNQHQPVNQQVQHSAEQETLEEIIEEPSNVEENDEWMTDDDELEDAESLIMTPTKARKGKLSPAKSRSSGDLNMSLAEVKTETLSPTKSQSPRKRSRRVLSMPPIF